MGRLSDARKKAKGAKGAAEVERLPAAADPIVAEPAPANPASEPVSFAAEGRKAPPTPQEEAAQRLADDLLAGIEGEKPEELVVVETTTTASPPAPYDDEDNGDLATVSSSSLPSSGLAEDLLAEMERRQAAKTKPQAAKKDSEEFMSAWPQEANPFGSPSANLSAEDFTHAHELEGDVLAMLGSNEPKPAAKPRGGLPSSGLADEILTDLPAPKVKTPLGMDEVHEFEAFFEEERAAEQLQLVLFHMETEIFALEIDRVQEIIRVPAITRVPHSQDAVRGVCNLRGRIVPVLDLRKLMRMVPKTIDRFNRIMVLDIAGKRIGVLIDKVSEVARINVPDVEPPPEELRAVDANLVTAVARMGERMIFILDVDRVLALQ